VPRKVVVLLSGGMDSATLAALQIKEGVQVAGLSVYYGQRHAKELEHAKELARILGLEHYTKVDLSSLLPLLAGPESSLTNPQVKVPLGHYAEESMKATVVPNRNMIMLSVAIGWAVTLNYNAVAFAAHAGDHAIYPDCRSEFVRAMMIVASIANYQPIDIISPFLAMGKHDIVSLGEILGVPWEQTWSCYQGRKYHCGQCGTCTERKEAFSLAGIVDPTIYEDTP
jgi:7-cyano-7-deazaguanine synthase